MDDPFATALDALFASPMAKDATYTASGGPALPIRVIREQPSDDVPFGAGHVVLDTNIFHVRRSDVSAPAKGDLIQVGEGPETEIFALAGKPKLDVEGMTWLCSVEPA